MLTTGETLYIWIGETQLIFARYDHLVRKAVDYAVYHLNPSISLNANLHEALGSVPLAADREGRVRVLFQTQAMLVPLAEFREDWAEKLYYYNFALSGEVRRRVFYDVLPYMDAVLLFAADKDACHTLEETYSDLLIQSAETPKLLHYASMCTADTKLKAFVNIMSTHMSVSVFQGNSVRMFITYPLHHVEDAAFYALRVLQMNEMGSEGNLLVNGDAKLRENLAKILNEYHPQAEAMRMENEFGKGMESLDEVLPYELIISMLRAY